MASFVQGYQESIKIEATCGPNSHSFIASCDEACDIPEDLLEPESNPIHYESFTIWNCLSETFAP